ncbi:MAG: cobalamin biosynthesis protein CbiD [Verrucomicrobia bacterium]|nr:cobalamin biosynthesis protein CbiD [Verrucomicrobiota bacterium]
MTTSRFDLRQLAENGLKRGFTTGTCATAAVKAALLKLICNETVDEVNVTLPDGTRYLTIPIDRICMEGNGAVRADVIKDAGDDPDQTHRARIFARVRRNASGKIVFLRGEGVGVVTQPGLQIGIGEPAINPEPRRMMLCAVRELLDEGDGDPTAGFDLQIGCENGAEIAKRTFNPRLGIEGGISILGTTGIVEPKSMAAFQASIEIYIRVALGGNPSEIVLAPGNLGQRFARNALQLPLNRVVQMANFVGFALDCVDLTLKENGHRLWQLWVIGHPGKLAKILDDAWDTHSQQSGSAVAAIHRVGREFGLAERVLRRIEQSRTVEGTIELLDGKSFAVHFWREVEERISAKISARLNHVERVAVRLFQMDGKALGGIA